MKITKSILIWGSITAGLLFTGCASSHANDYIYQGINFGADRDASFQKGVQDACKTADGDYTKNHTLFKSNISYRVGWEDGRLHCKGRK